MKYRETMLFSILPTLPLLTVLSAFFFFLPYLDGKRLTPLTKDSTETCKWEKKTQLVTLLKINTIKL